MILKCFGKFWQLLTFLIKIQSICTLVCQNTKLAWMEKACDLTSMFLCMPYWNTDMGAFPFSHDSLIFCIIDNDSDNEVISDSYSSNKGHMICCMVHLFLCCHIWRESVSMSNISISVFFLIVFKEKLCSCCVTYAIYDESTIYSSLILKELLAHAGMISEVLSDCNRIQTLNHLVCK